MIATKDIELWNPERVFCELSKDCDLIVLYPTKAATYKVLLMDALAKDLGMTIDSMKALVNDKKFIGVYSGEYEDITSLLMLLGAYPYNELLYFAHYSKGALIEENIPEEVR